MNHIGKLIRNNRGSVVVEFALLTPILLMLIMGIIELGSAWYAKQMMVNASREGARIGALFGDSTAAEVEQQVQNILTRAGFPNDAHITATGVEGDPGDLVTVQVTSNHPFSVLGSLVPSLPEVVTLSASTVMRHE